MKIVEQFLWIASDVVGNVFTFVGLTGLIASIVYAYCRFIFRMIKEKSQ